MPNSEDSTKKSVNRLRLLNLSLVLFVLIWLGFRLLSPDLPTIFAGTQPSNLGVTNHHLAPCPSTPNCVSSESNDSEHYIQPLSYSGNNISAIRMQLENLLNQQPRIQVIASTDNYIYAQATTRWLGFVDDLEFYFNPEQPGLITVRSASRLGESDLGVNRARIEGIRAAFS